MSDDRTFEVTVTRFTAALSQLDRTMQEAVKVSEGRMGIDHTGRQNRTLYLFAKLIAHCMSILSISNLGRPRPEGVGLMDHSSIAALGRVVVDCSIMTMYISEPSLGLNDWKLGMAVLRLHELSNRKRFLLALEEGPFPFFEHYASSRRELQIEITKLVQNTGRSDSVEDLIKGQRVFLDGARGAAREGGWNVKGIRILPSISVKLGSFVPRQLYDGGRTEHIL